METKEIWEQYSNDLRKYLLTKTGNKELTKDLLQEVFIKVHIKKSQVKSSHKIKSWLYRVATNILYDHYRHKEANGNIVPINTSEETESHSAANCLMPLILELPELYQHAILLSEIKELKQHQVAEILGISLSGAKSRIQRGRKMLQQGYMRCCNYNLNKKGVLVGETKSEEDCKVCN